MNTLHIFTNAFTGGSCMNQPPKNFKWIFNEYIMNVYVQYLKCKIIKILFRHILLKK